MNEQERDGFIRKIGIAADDSDDLEDDEEEENDPGHHKYNCKKCQVSFGVWTFGEGIEEGSWVCELLRPGRSAVLESVRRATGPCSQP